MLSWADPKHLNSNNIPWKKIFKSFITPLSDATEEKSWQKLVQRATFVHNRDNKRTTAAEKACRMCKECEESMLHIIKCRKAQPLWKAVIDFCCTVIGTARPNNATEAIILGRWSRGRIELFAKTEYTARKLIELTCQWDRRMMSALHLAGGNCGYAPSWVAKYGKVGWCRME